MQDVTTETIRLHFGPPRSVAQRPQALPVKFAALDESSVAPRRVDQVVVAANTRGSYRVHTIKLACDRRVAAWRSGGNTISSATCSVSNASNSRLTNNDYNVAYNRISKRVSCSC